MATHHACDDWDRMIAGDEGKNYVYILIRLDPSYYKLTTSGAGLGNTEWQCLDRRHQNYNFGPIKFQN